MRRISGFSNYLLKRAYALRCERELSLICQGFCLDCFICITVTYICYIFLNCNKLTFVVWMMGWETSIWRENFNRSRVVFGTLSHGRYIVGMYFGDSHIPMLLFREFRFVGRKSLIWAGPCWRVSGVLSQKRVRGGAEPSRVAGEM